MSKKFRENCLWLLKTVYYMEDPKKISKEAKRRASSEELAKVMTFLENKGFISIRKEETPMHINLTDKGIDFFVNELNRNKQEEFNGIIAVTGAVIALVAIYNFFISFDSLKNNGTINVIFLLLIFFCFASIVFFVINYWIMLRRN